MTKSKELLDAAHQRLTEELEEVKKELLELGAHDDGSLKVTLDEGFADAAQTTSERSKVLSIVERLQNRSRDIKAALERLDKGTYGRCESCGGEISPERLEAIPAARHCINCARNS